MEGLYKAVVVLPFRSGLPEDVAVNDFYFLGSNPGTDIEDDVLSLQTRIQAFYNDIHAPATKSISDYISDVVSRTAGSTRTLFYFEDAIAPPAVWGSPVGTSSWTIALDDNVTPMPAEVCAVLSYHGDLTDIPETAANPTPPPLTIRPAARRRGRLFIGPLNNQAGSAAGANLDWIPDATFRETLAEGGAYLLSQNGDLEWVVASRTAGQVFEVVGGYVDNAFDTQRRRGSAPTGRTIWP